MAPRVSPKVNYRLWVIMKRQCRFQYSYVFSSSHVRMWELDHKEGWEPKNWCFQIVVLENTCESSLDCKIKPVKPKRNQPWIFLGKTNSEAETPIVWSPDVKSQLIGKDPDAGKDWRQEEKGVTEERLLDSITNSMNMNLSKLQEIVENRGAWHAAVHGVAQSDMTWQLNNNNY